MRAPRRLEDVVGEAKRLPGRFFSLDENGVTDPVAEEGTKVDAGPQQCLFENRRSGLSKVPRLSFSKMGCLWIDLVLPSRRNAAMTGRSSPSRTVMSLGSPLSSSASIAERSRGSISTNTGILHHHLRGKIAQPDRFCEPGHPISSREVNTRIDFVISQGVTVDFHPGRGPAVHRKRDPTEPHPSLMDPGRSSRPVLPR